MNNLAALVSLREDVSLQQGTSVGAIWTLYDLARQLGIHAALGSTRQGKLALWQVIARVLDQGSRLSAAAPRWRVAFPACRHWDNIGKIPGWNSLSAWAMTHCLSPVQNIRPA